MSKTARAGLYAAGFVILAVFSFLWIMLAKPEKVETTQPSSPIPSISSVAPQASEGMGEALPVKAVKYGSTVEVSGLKATVTNPQVVDFGEDLKTVVSVKIENTGQTFEFESRYGFQFIDGAGNGSIAADTIGFQTVGTGFARNGEVQIDAVNDNFRHGKLLLIDRTTGIPVGAWSL